MEANSIDEYLELRAKGVTDISFKTSNSELLEFVMAEMKGSQLERLTKYNINTVDNNYFYNLKSRFPFGKHKENSLKSVYKCDPQYIEWCLINADSFCIEEKSLDILEKVKPWISEDLTFIENGNQEYLLDIRNFEVDDLGFPFSEEIRETSFNFSTLAKNKNRGKLKEKLNLYTVLRGSKWEDQNPVSFPNERRKKIKILSQC